MHRNFSIIQVNNFEAEIKVSEIQSVAVHSSTQSSSSAIANAKPTKTLHMAMAFVEHIRKSCMSDSVKVPRPEHQNADQIRLAATAYVDYAMDNVSSDGIEIDAIAFWQYCATVSTQIIIPNNLHSFQSFRPIRAFALTLFGSPCSSCSVERAFSSSGIALARHKWSTSPT